MRHYFYHFCSSTLTIARKELIFFIYSPFISISFFLLTLVHQFYFYIYIVSTGLYENIDLLQEMVFFIFIFISLMASRTIVAERVKSTLSILLNIPISSASIVIGKYLAYVIVFLIFLMITLLSYLLVLSMGFSINYLLLMTQYMGFFLLGCTCISLGILVSSFTNNQLVCNFIVIVVVILFFQINSIDVLGIKWLDFFLDHIRLQNNLLYFYSGIINLQSICYFLLINALFLFGSIQFVDYYRYSYL